MEAVRELEPEHHYAAYQRVRKQQERTAANVCRAGTAAFDALHTTNRVRYCDAVWHPRMCLKHTHSLAISTYLVFHPVLGT